MNGAWDTRRASARATSTNSHRIPAWAFGRGLDFVALLQRAVDHAAQHLPVAGVLLHWRTARWPDMPSWYVSQTLDIHDVPHSVLSAIARWSPASQEHAMPISLNGESHPFRLLVLVPVTWQHQSLGTLAALLPQTQVPWRLRESLAFYARIIAHLFAHVQLALDLYTLLEATRHLVESDSVETILERLLGYATVLTDTEAGSVLLYEEQERALVFAASIGPVAPRLKALRVPLASAAGRAFETGEPVILQPVTNGEGHWPGVDRVTGFVTRSLVAVPILARGKPVGVLEVINKRGGLFDTHDVDILQGLAYYAGAVIQQAQAAARQAQALHARQADEERRMEWLRVLSHELRTPVTIIRGYAELLADEVTRLSQEKRTAVDAELLLTLSTEIMRGVQRLTESVDQMVRAFTTMDKGLPAEPVPVPVNDVVGEAWLQVKPRADAKRLQVALHLPETSPTLPGYPPLLREAVFQILDNAVKFTPEQGHVRVHVKVNEGEVLISVTDTGPGIPADKLNDIFLPFYQVEDPLIRKHGGLGLGLTIAKEAVERLGGRILVESVMGRGSTFTVALPLARDAGQLPLS